MTLPGSRRRIRKIPNPLMGSIHNRAGEFFRRLSVNHNWEPWNPRSYHMMVPETPYQKLELVADDKHSGPPFRTGGPFTSFKVWLPSVQINGVGQYDTGTSFFNGWLQQYRGGFTPLFGSIDGLSAKYGDLDELLTTETAFPSSSGYEEEAYEKLRPRLSKAGVTVAVAELRDLPRMLQGTARGFHDLWSSIGGRTIKPFMDPKSSADHFLNVQFGWKPFLSDLNKVYKTYQKQELYIRAITRDNNRWIRRRFLHEEVESDQLITEGVGFAVTPQGPLFDRMCQVDGLGRRAFYTVREVKSSQVVSVGSFKYYRPEFDETLVAYSSQYNQLMRLATIYGFRVNPSTIYQVLPWSWLIDWFTKTGDVIQRGVDWGVDSIVARYIYQMHRFTRKLVLTQTINFKTGPVTMSWERLVSSKKRREADTGYGFNLQGNLSPLQLAILAALGLSRQ